LTGLTGLPDGREAMDVCARKSLGKGQEQDLLDLTAKNSDIEIGQSCDFICSLGKFMIFFYIAGPEIQRKAQIFDSQLVIEFTTLYF